MLTLVAGGAIAQALPLLLGPWLSRLYTPQQFGQYNLFAAVAANVAVVACARYEFALPLLGDASEAAALRALCLRVLAGVTLASAVGAAAWFAWSSQGWTAWLPVAVAVLGWLSLATLWATRAQAYRALAIARVVQYGGAALAQVGAALLGAGVPGLIAAPIAAAAAAAALLRLPLREVDPATALRSAQDDESSSSCAKSQDPRRWRTLARRFKDFRCSTPRTRSWARCRIRPPSRWSPPGRAPSPPASGASRCATSRRPRRWWAARSRRRSIRNWRRTAPPVDHDADADAPLRVTREGRAAVRRVMAGLAAIAAPLVLLLWAFAPWAFEALFGPHWRGAGELARALGLYIGVHFVAAPLAVVTLAWGAQAWALRLALVGQVAFVAALAAGLKLGGLPGAGWAVSIAMTLYFGYYFLRLATWPLTSKESA